MLTSQLVSTIEFYLNRLKNQFGLKRIAEPSSLYPYFSDVCSLQDLNFIQSCLDIEKIFKSAIPSTLAIELTNPNKDKAQLIRQAAYDLTRALGVAQDDSFELCNIIARVIIGSSLISVSQSNAYSASSLSSTVLSDFVLVPEDTYRQTCKSFYMCIHQVTQKEYEDIMGYNPSEFNNNPNNPVENVSWFDAVSYCNKRSIKEGLVPCYFISSSEVTTNDQGQGYRLPIYEEWKFAAMGGSYFYGNSYSGSCNIDEVAWYSGNSGGTTHPVMQKKPNELGIYDMTGNVLEWVNDNGDNGEICFYLGGAWFCDASQCLNSSDSWDSPSEKGNGLGFRIARSHLPFFDNE